MRLAADLSTGCVDIRMIVDADDPAEAMVKALATVRAAVHAIVDATPDWETTTAVMHVAPAHAADRLLATTRPLSQVRTRVVVDQVGTDDLERRPQDPGHRRARTKLAHPEAPARGEHAEPGPCRARQVPDLLHREQSSLCTAGRSPDQAGEAEDQADHAGLPQLCCTLAVSTCPIGETWLATALTGACRNAPSMEAARPRMVTSTGSIGKSEMSATYARFVTSTPPLSSPN